MTRQEQPSTEHYFYTLVEGNEEHSLEDQLVLLSEVTQSFAFSLDIDETLRNALQKFMEYLDAEASSVFLLENDGSELVCQECAGPVDILGLRLPSDKGIVGKAVTDKSCQMVRDVNPVVAQYPVGTSAGSYYAATCGLVARSIVLCESYR